MYQPKKHAPPSREAMLALIDAHPLGVLITHDGAGAVADHLPFLLRRDDAGRARLEAHVARANPVWQHLARAPQVLVVFQGPSHYLSPNWYPSKKHDGKVVPTWNYQAVHVRGRVRVIDDDTLRQAMLERLTEANERPMHGDASWRVSDAPADYIEKLSRAIVCFDIEIDDLQGRWKLAQDEAPEDRRGAIAGLAALGTPAALAVRDHMTAIAPTTTPLNPGETP